MGYSGAIIAGAAVIGAASSIYSATRSGPDIPAAPPPAGYINYDEDGNPAGSQVWDAATNSYIYKPAPLTEEQKVDKAKRAEMRAALLDNLSKTPEDRVKAYENYAQSFSDAMHTDVDKQFTRLKTSQEEALNARGMTGSKAYADTIASLNQDKIGMDTEIAQKAVLAKEELANTDRTFWLNELNSLDNKESTDSVQAMQKQNIATQGSIAGTSALMAKAAVDNSNTLQSWQIKTGQMGDLSKNISGSATGLAFLYGYKGTGKTPEYGIGKST